MTGKNADERYRHSARGREVRAVWNAAQRVAGTAAARSRKWRTEHLEEVRAADRERARARRATARLEQHLRDRQESPYFFTLTGLLQSPDPYTLARRVTARRAHAGDNDGNVTWHGATVEECLRGLGWEAALPEPPIDGATAAPAPPAET